MVCSIVAVGICFPLLAVRMRHRRSSDQRAAGAPLAPWQMLYQVMNGFSFFICIAQ